MENAVDALKIAFAVFIFVMALTVSIVSFNNAKSTADVILYTKDKTNYYEYETAIGKASENRIVGLETVIPTLFRYYKENFTVVFRKANYDDTTGKLTNIQYLPVYETSSNVDLWADSYENDVLQKYNVNNISTTKAIFSFDLDEEIKRHEPWTGSIDKAKSNLDAFLNGSVYISPVDNKEYKNYSEDLYLKGSYRSESGFIAKYKTAKFVETTGEYVYNSDADESDIANSTKEKTKRIIIYTLIK
ncbi:MAG: hypothetical protein J6A29_06635 [Clostridia bacterium]|nr:hypothetical protein [Clostridia bacterium]